MSFLLLILQIPEPNAYSKDFQNQILIQQIMFIRQQSTGSWLKGMKLDEFPSSNTRAFFCLLLKPHPQKKRKFCKKEEKRLENKIIKQQMNE